MVRRQRLNLLFDAQRNMRDGIFPSQEIKGAIFLLVSGLLLITPGFFTDIIGFLMFIPKIQNTVSRIAQNYFKSKIRR